MTVNHLKVSIDWYEKHFGFELVESGQATYGPYAIIKSGTSMLCLNERKKRTAIDDSGHSNTYHRIYHFGLSIKDRPQWEKKFQEENFTVTYLSQRR